MCGTHGLEDVCFPVLTHTRPNQRLTSTVRSNRLSCTVLWWAQLNEEEDVDGGDLPYAITITACTLIFPPVSCCMTKSELFPNASKLFDAQFDGECGSRLLTYL